jgi:GTP-binding protein EngB required for normal cell division
MMHPLQSLQTELDETIRLLDQSPMLSFTREEKESLAGEARELSNKLSSIEGSFLTAGLLGGTGVGKSTFMNALAGSEIASTSHRRPHTDAVLVYRHSAANPLLRPAKDVPWKEITHDEKAVQQVILCDLPDFDSMLGEHRECVLEFMEHLDVLIWVSSPEKYADQRFYEFLQQVPKARQNFYFVLNKVDLLFGDGKLEKGYEQMALVASQFQGHIKKSGIESPVLYTCSSIDALHSDEVAPWNQFPALRQQIFQQRDMKQIRAIKAANLDVEVQQLHLQFEKEVLHLKSLDKLVHETAQELEGQRSEWIETGREAIELWLRRRIKPEFLSRQGNPSSLVGPSRSLSILLRGSGKRGAEERGVSFDSDSLVPSEDVLLTFRRRMEWLGERLHHYILRENLPAAFQEWIKQRLDTAGGNERLKERLSHGAALYLGRRTSKPSRRFQVAQFLTFFSLLVLFLFAVGGEAAWLEVLKQPDAGSLLRLLLSGVHTLFSGKGLAALGSFVVLNFLFALRFYRRYRHLQEKAAEKAVEALKGVLGKVWEEELVGVLRDVNRLRQEIQDKISAIAGLRAQKTTPAPEGQSENPLDGG